MGPRQCGKTTLARSFGEPHQAHYFDLESVVDQRRLQNPELMLSSLDGVIILDEIQYQPELFNLLDQDLLTMHPFEGIEIVTVQEFAVYTV